ncbi:hypothetical protein V8C86DRAFT_3133318, partial [Haematococcus lacustris]
MTPTTSDCLSEAGLRTAEQVQAAHAWPMSTRSRIPSVCSLTIAVPIAVALAGNTPSHQPSSHVNHFAAKLVPAPGTSGVRSNTFSTGRLSHGCDHCPSPTHMASAAVNTSWNASPKLVNIPALSPRSMTQQHSPRTPSAQLAAPSTASSRRSSIADMPLKPGSHMRHSVQLLSSRPGAAAAGSLRRSTNLSARASALVSPGALLNAAASLSGTRARQLAYARSLASRQSGSSAAHPRNKATPTAAGSEAGTCSHIGSALPSPPSSPPAEELDAQFPALNIPNSSLAAHAPKSSLPAPPTSAQRATSTNAREIPMPASCHPASTKSSAHTSPATTPRKLQPIRVEQQVRHQVEDSSTSGQCVSAQSESGGQPENHYSSWGGSSEGSSLGDNAAGSSRKPLTSHLLLPCPSLLPDMMLYTGALSPSRSSTPTSARTALRRSAAPPSPSSLSASCKPAEKHVPPSGFTPAPGPAQYQGSLRCDSPDLLPHLSHTSEPTALPGTPGTHRLEEDDGVLVCSFGGAELGAGCCSLPHQPYPWADGLASDNTDASSTSPTPGDTCAHRVAEDTALKAFQDHNAHGNNSASIDTAAGDMKGGSEAGALPRHQSTTAAFDMLQASMGHGFVVMTRAGQSPRAGRVVPTTDAPAPVSAGWVRPTLSATHPPAAELLPTYPRGIQGMSGSGLGSTSARALTTPRNGTPPSAGSWRAGGGASDFRIPAQCRGNSPSGLGAGCSAGGGGDGEVQTPGSVQSNTAWQISSEVERRSPLDLVSPGGAGSARGTGSGSKSAADPRMLAAQLRVKEHSMAAVSTQLVLMLAQLAHQTQTTQ